METGFPPIIDKNSRVLILGTMPSVKSLQQQEYYAHPQNTFWWIMGKLFGAHQHEAYQLRQQILRKQGIAVWDVIYQCYRAGSLDSAIDAKTVVANDFTNKIIKPYHIERIFFNGKSAESLFKRYVIKEGQLNENGIAMQALPSTSPANARLKREEKLKIWRRYLLPALKA